MTYDKTGRVIDRTIDGTDPRAGNPNFAYDGAGRLTAAWIPGRTYTYTYGTQAAGCAQGALQSGWNTNRTAMTEQIGTGTPTTTTCCYDRADRLTSSSSTAVGTLVYDGHGNTTSIFGETHAYDAADRHQSTTKTTTTVTYTRDALDRIVARTSGSTVTRYSFTGPGDSATITLTSANVLIERTLALPGGVLYTSRAGGNVWSYPNIHGDHTTRANAAGAKLGSTTTYDPYGRAVGGTVPDNSNANFDYGWLGQHQRPTETQAGLQPTIEMRARHYSPLLGRFTETDPTEGGSCNDYDYTAGDPINFIDLSGEQKAPKLSEVEKRELEKKSRERSRAPNSRES